MERIRDNKDGTYTFIRDGKELHTGKWGDNYVAPKKTNLFDFSTPFIGTNVTGGGMTAPIQTGMTTPTPTAPLLRKTTQPTTSFAAPTGMTGTTLPTSTTPATTSGLSNLFAPKASAAPAQKMNLFSDELEAFRKMKADNMSDDDAYAQVKARRQALMGGNTGLSTIESAALLKMQQDGMSAKEAINQLQLHRSQTQPETPEDNRPLWKKAGEGTLNFMAGNLQTLLQYGGNIMDLGTGGAMGFGQDVKSMMEQNKELYGDSTAFKAGTVMPDIALATAPLPKAVAGMGWIKGGAAVGAGFGALQPLLEKGTEATVTEMTQGALMGGAMGALTGGVLKGGAKALEYATSKLPAKLQLSGLLNPAKLEKIKNALISEGEKSPEDVAKWMLDRGIKGDKNTIIKMLEERAKTSKSTVDAELAKIKEKIRSDDAKKALSQLYDDLSKVAGMEANAAKIKGWLGKKRFTLSELNEIKREMDNVYNIYKQSGEVSAGLKAQGLDNIRKGIKTLIENEAAKRGFGDVRMLNNETQVSKALSEAIAKKETADYVRELLSPFASRVAGGVLGSQVGPFDGNTIEGKVGNIIVGALAGGATQSTRLKTNVASFLNRFTKQEISVLEKYLSSKGATQMDDALLKKTNAGIDDIVQQESAPLSKGETPETKGNADYQKAVAEKYGKKAGIAEEDVSSAVKEITDAYPDAKVEIQDKILTDDGQEASGMYDPETNTIYLSKDAAVKTTAWHEATHWAIAQLKKNDLVRYKQIEKLAKEQHGENWEEWISEETHYFKEKGKFRTGNMKNAIKEWIKNVVNRITGGKNDPLRQFYNDVIGGKIKSGEFKSNVGKKFQLAGEGAKEAPRGQLENAKKMEKEGKDADAIWQQTGWERGADGKWTFEIDDSKAKILNKGTESGGYKLWHNNQIITGKAQGRLSLVSVKDLLEHNDLLKQYPEIGDINIRVGTEGNADMSFKQDTIHISNKFADMLGNKDTDKFTSTLLHEIQHAIQEREGFAKGGSPDAMDILSGYTNIDKAIKDLQQAADNADLFSESTKYLKGVEILKQMKAKGIKLSDENAMSIYKKLAGEVQSRNVQDRLEMTPEQRRLLRPEKTESVPRSEQIVRGEKKYQVKEIEQKAQQHKDAKSFEENLSPIDFIKIKRPDLKIESKNGINHITFPDGSEYQFNPTSDGHVRHISRKGYETKNAKQPHGDELVGLLKEWSDMRGIKLWLDNNINTEFWKRNGFVNTKNARGIVSEGEYFPKDIKLKGANPKDVEQVQNNKKMVSQFWKDAQAPQKKYQVKLEDEAKKYKSAEEFRDAHTANSIMDLSNPEKHRLGRLIEDGVDEDTGRYMDTKYMADKYGSRGNNEYAYQKSAKVPDVKSPEDIVTIYRGTVKSQKEMMPGDFVSFSKEYASGHNVGGHVLELKVPAKDVVWQGADLHEWIYSPEKLRGGNKYQGGLKQIWKDAQGKNPLKPNK